MDRRTEKPGARSFSNRIDWRREENALSRAEALRRRAGRPLFDLTETNPTNVALLDEVLTHAVADTLAFMRDSVVASGRGRRGGDGDGRRTTSASRRTTSAYAPHPRGLATARQAIADEYARAGTRIDPDRLIITASSSESYSYLCKLLCDPGDGLLIPEPSYPLFDYLARLDGITPLSYRLAHDGTRRGDWEIDLASVDQAVASFSARVGALVVVSPNNPTGSVVREHELAELDHRAARSGFALVSDEVFADYLDPTPTSPSSFPERPPPVKCVGAHPSAALTFSLGGLSKSCGMPQLKLGWMLVGGPAPLVESALERLDLIADTYLSVGTPVQESLPGLFRAGALIRAAISERIAVNRRQLEHAIGRNSPLTLLKSDGGWSAIIRLPATRTDEDWALALLNEDGVLCHPGYFFDLRGGTFLVVSLLPIPAIFAEAARRLCARVADSVPPAAP